MSEKSSTFATEMTVKSTFTHIWSSSAVRNIGKLISANVIAQVLGILVYPILTRLYSPEDFGLFNLFCSIGGVLILLACLDYHNAIVLPKTDEEARGVVHVSLLSIAILTIILTSTIPFAPYVAMVFKSQGLATYYWLLPAYVCLMSIWHVLNYWYVRRKAYGRVSGYQISQSLFSAGYKTGFGFLGVLQGGLIYSSVLSPLCSLVLSTCLAAKKHIRPLFTFNKEECRKVALKYANFPKFSLPHSLLNTIAGQLPVFLLTPLFSAREVGLWSMALLLSFTPISILSNAVYQVLAQKTSEKVNNCISIVGIYRRFTFLTLGLIVPFFTLLWFVLPALTTWLLGAEWRLTGVYIQWLLPWLVCNTLCASTGFLYNIFFKQKQGLYFEIAIATGRLLGLGIGIYFHNFELAIACYAILSAIINGIQYGWLMLLVKKYETSI